MIMVFFQKHSKHSSYGNWRLDSSSQKYKYSTRHHNLTRVQTTRLNVSFFCCVDECLKICTTLFYGHRQLTCSRRKFKHRNIWTNNHDMKWQDMLSPKPQTNIYAHMYIYILGSVPCSNRTCLSPMVTPSAATRTRGRCQSMQAPVGWPVSF